MPRNYKRITSNVAMSWSFRQLPFWERVKAQTIIDENGCHIFTGAKDGCGYGRIHNDEKKLVRLHRATWERDHGQLKSGDVVCHTCDIPACINPAHLFVGSQTDNIKDMDLKGRRRTLIGQEQGNSKLKNENIPVIRSMLKNGKTCAYIAGLFGVSEGMIRHIKHGRAWTHIP